MFGNLMTSCPIGVRRSRLQHGLWSAVTMLLPERLPHGRAPAVSHFKPHAEHLPFAHIVSQVVAYTREIAEAANVVGSKVHRVVLSPSSIPLSTLPMQHQFTFNSLIPHTFPTQPIREHVHSTSISTSTMSPFRVCHHLETSRALEHSARSRVRVLSISEIRIARNLGSPSHGLLSPARGSLADAPTWALPRSNRRRANALRQASQ